MTLTIAHPFMPMYWTPVATVGDVDPMTQLGSLGLTGQRLVQALTQMPSPVGRAMMRVMTGIKGVGAVVSQGHEGFPRALEAGKSDYAWVVDVSDRRVTSSNAAESCTAGVGGRVAARLAGIC